MCLIVHNQFTFDKRRKLLTNPHKTGNLIISSKRFSLPGIRLRKKPGRNKKLKSTLTGQNFQAFSVTTRCMVAIIDKIFENLKPKRFYISHLLGDDVELLFSAVRQFKNLNLNFFLFFWMRNFNSDCRPFLKYY